MVAVQGTLDPPPPKGPNPTDDHLDEQRLRRLIDVGRGLLSQLDAEAVLDQVLETAREITGARYAALGVLDRDRRELERFITQGIDAETHRSIGDLPRGRGILGVLIDDPRPLRIPVVGEHPKSYGFPPGHPPMSSFLGVPVVVRDQVWGNLYLTEKQGGAEFDAVDEESVVILAAWAAIAIENARLYEVVAARRDELEQSARRLEASRAVAVAVGAEMELDERAGARVADGAPDRRRQRAAADLVAPARSRRRADGGAGAAGRPRPRPRRPGRVRSRRRVRELQRR
jgi:GAF domain-containing protein